MKNTTILLTLLLFVLAMFSGFAQKDKTATGSMTMTSGIIMENMDTSVDPGNNFMEYVNGNWIKSNTIPADKSSYGSFNVLRDNAEDEVKAIIEGAAAGDFKVGSDEQKLGDLYASYMNIDKRNEIGITPLQKEFDKIDAIADYDALNTYFAYAIKRGINAPLGMYVEQDFKNPEIYTVYINQSGLGMPDKEYYLKTDKRSEEIKVKYMEHIGKMFDLAGLGNGTSAAATVMDLETKLAEKQMDKEDTRNLVENYNMIATDSLPEIMPDFNFQGFLKEAGLEKQDKLGVMMLGYTQALDTIITATDLKTWKTYLKWSVINAKATELNDALDQQNFEFYSKELQGTEEQRPMWRRAVSVVNSNLGEIVGKLYVDNYFPPAAKQRMEGLVANLLKAYESSIKELDWMSAETKKEALDKLNKFSPKIGYPDKWKTYDIEIKPDDLYGNLDRATVMEYERELAKLGQPIDRDEWGMTPQTVNAYYNATKNEIVFPAAILQPPFFDMEAEDAVNYGGIGAVIGHEIGHGFDDAGSTFDGDGAMRNWWTETDNEKFEKRTNALVAQYNDFKVLPDVNVNGKFTLGENIGDLGGLNIALKAYHLSLNGKKSERMDGFTGDQRVFIGWAQVWNGKSRDEALRSQVSSDPHSPREFRVNGVVRNIPEFYEAFKVQKTDTLYLDPEDRVKIW
ncbi:MAG TPA: M13 family peptidase [Pricia antarctica]|uniref:M13 family peptidase n=3 Tax=root TaxID=1 RepID=A0A831QS59_9FLAO|nr:M13 family peptidase [Pricia antarctica]